MAHLVTIIKVVQALEEAKDRIYDPSIRKQWPSVTFFSVNDIWIYHAVYDIRLCPVCQTLDSVGAFTGNRLRRAFPYMEITSVDMISVRVHPNCRCYLSRLVKVVE